MQNAQVRKEGIPMTGVLLGREGRREKRGKKERGWPLF